MTGKIKLIEIAEGCAKVQLTEVSEDEAVEICDQCGLADKNQCDGYDGGFRGPGSLIRELLALIDQETPQEGLEAACGYNGTPSPAETRQSERETAKRVSVLRNAEAHISGDRDHDYGGPEDSFGTIARLWNGYIQALNGVYNPMKLLKPHDVAAMMILLKVARIPGNPGKADTWEDIAGYAGCGWEVAYGSDKS